MKRLPLLLILLSPWPVHAQTRPAGGSNPPPQTAPAPADPSPAPAGKGPLGEVLRALTLTEHQQQILTGVRDGLSSPESTGWYFMLAKLADLPEVPHDQWQRFDAPAPENLRQNPGRYRYQPLRMTVLVYGVQPLTVHNGQLTTSPYWPADKPIYAIFCTADDDARTPLMLYAPQPPQGLPEPSEVTADGQQLFPRGPRFRTLAVFYNVIRRQSRGSEDAPAQQTDYPVLLAWQFRRASMTEGYSWRHFSFAGLLGVGIALFVAGFIYLKRQLRKDKGHEGGLFRNYKPLRNAEDDEPVEGPVDPDLVEAVRRKTPTESKIPEEPPRDDS